MGCYTSAVADRGIILEGTGISGLVFTATSTSTAVGVITRTLHSNYTIDDISCKEITSNGNIGAIRSATTTTGYTSSPHGVVDPLNYGELYSGRALDFDGSNDAVNIPNSSEWNMPKTVSMWFKCDTIATNGAQVYQKDTLMGYDTVYWGIQLDSTNNKIQYYFHDGSARTWLSDTAITIGKWHHLVAVSTSSNSTIYLDGLSVGTNSLTWLNNTVPSLQQLKIGSYGSSSSLSRPFNGKINHVKIFNSELTQDQVRSLYTSPEIVIPNGVSASNLKLDLPMQEGSGLYVYDGSGNQNHGTIAGATWATGEEYGYQSSLVRSNTPMIFDGVDDYVNLQAPSLFDDIFDGGGTFSCWFNAKSDGENNVGRIVDKDRWGIFPKDESSGTVKIQFQRMFTAWGKWYVTGVTLNQWHHIVVTYDSSSVSNDPIIYIDGSSQTVTEDEAPSGSRVSDATKDLLLGSYKLTHNYDGLVNEVAIWNTSLDSDAVTALYGSGTPLDVLSDSGNYDNSSALQGYWRNDGITTWTDRSTNSNNGTASGSPVSIVIPEGNTSGRDNQGFLLTDTTSISNGIRLHKSEYINIQDSEALSFGDGTDDRPFSIEAWVKMDNSVDFPIADKGIYNSNAEWRFEINSLRFLYLFLFDESVANTHEHAYYNASLQSYENQWIYVACTYDGRGGTSANAGIKLYLNGSSVTTTLGGSGTYVAMENLGANVKIGHMDYGSGSTFADGLLDEVRIYSKELSASEILKNYNSSKSSHS